MSTTRYPNLFNVCFAPVTFFYFIFLSQQKKDQFRIQGWSKMRVWTLSASSTVRRIAKVFLSFNLTLCTLILLLSASSSNPLFFFSYVILTHLQLQAASELWFVAGGSLRILLVAFSFSLCVWISADVMITGRICLCTSSDIPLYFKLSTLLYWTMVWYIFSHYPKEWTITCLLYGLA